MSAIEQEVWRPYVTPNITSIDTALQKGDFSRAGQYTAEVIERHRQTPEATLPSELFHAMIKQIALPLYERVYSYLYGTEDVFSGHRTAEVEAVYGHAVELLEKLHSIMDDTEPSYAEGERYIGYASELTMMALFCRQLTGEASDRYDILPSYRESDRGDRPVNGIRNGFDFVLIDYDTAHDAYLQIKTSLNPDRAYADTITVISAAEIAGGTRADLRLLQEALIAECTSGADNDQIERIEQATAQLYGKLPAQTV